MATGKYSRVDGRKSSSYCSTISMVAFVALCLVGSWMFMSSTDVNPKPVVDVPSSQETATHDKQSIEVESTTDNSNVQDESKVQETETESNEGEKTEEAREEPNEDQTKEDSSENGNGEKNEETVSNQGGKTEPREEPNGDGTKEDGSSGEAGSDSESDGVKENGNGEESGSEDGSAEKPELNKSTDDSNQDKNGSSDEGDSKPTEEGVNENQGKDKAAEVFPAGAQSELLTETNTQNGAWSTQVAESQKEKSVQESSDAQAWKLCNTTAGPDYIPCLDNWQAIRKLTSTKHYEHRERHCPDEAPTCVVPMPEGYKRSIKWPASRDKIWYYNVPHTKLAEVKGHQNWVKVTGEYLTFPGGGTQFKHGALHYIDFIQKSLADIAWGKRSRVILDVGCGVASFGGYLFDRDVLAMSFAPKDEHEAQVQFALERGIPATLAVMGTKRLPFPGYVFDLVHCARCRVPWHIEGGKLLLELNRVLRPGGYFVWSATPVYQKLQEDVGIWEEMSKLTKAMCWELIVIKKDAVNGVGAAIYRKPSSNECYNQRTTSQPPLCKESDDPNAAWNVPLEACMHRVPEDESVRGSKWPEQWPQRLESPPYWLKSQVGVYGKAGQEDFVADYNHWKKVVSQSYLKGMGINWGSVRNVMDMRAVYGGFAAALKDVQVWVMNVVPIDSPDTLPIIYERGLFGMYHDWCQSFNTYPRTYDVLHADHLLSVVKKRCNLVGVFAEVDRILRPEGKLIVRDNAEMITEVEKLAKSLHWDVRMIYSKEGEGLACIQKTMWRPTEVQLVSSAIM
ncbi:Probable methyltransferase PMT24 [Linum grandiflorum]